MLVLLALMWWTPRARGRGEPLVAAMLALGQVAIACMLPSAADAFPFYMLGFSLVPLGSGCLMPGRPAWTIVQVVITVTGFGVSVLAFGRDIAGPDVVASAFFLLTASSVAVLAHVLRHRQTMREVAARTALEHEQARTRELLGELERLSQEDPLTGLANRRRWDAELGAACAAGQDDGAGVTVLLVDLDRFKAINDHHGHGGGDRALQDVARLLQDHDGQDRLVARLGGDELGVLVRGLDEDGSQRLAEGLREAVTRLRPFADGSGLTVSIGVAWAPGEADADELTRCADAALYRAKATRDAVCLDSPAPLGASRPA